MISFNLSCWGALARLNENNLASIMELVEDPVYLGICRDGRFVAKARERSKQDSRARSVKGAQTCWGAYVVVCDMIESAVRTSIFDNTVPRVMTVEGKADVLLNMFYRGFVEDVACGMLDLQQCAPPAKITAYPNSYTHTMIFHGVVIMVSAPCTPTGHISIVAHYELAFVYNIFDLCCCCGSYDAKLKQFFLINEYAQTMVQILDLRLNYAKNPQGMTSASMGKAVLNLIPKKPVMGVGYYDNYDDTLLHDHLGEIEDDRVPTDAFTAYVQCAVGSDPKGVNTAMLAANQWNGCYLGYAVFWKD
jgi:hypothetical protein